MEKLANIVSYTCFPKVDKAANIVSQPCYLKMVKPGNIIIYFITDLNVVFSFMSSYFQASVLFETVCKSKTSSQRLPTHDT